MEREKLTAGSDYFPEGSRAPKEVIHTGCTILDCALGGGWPLGRVVNIVGDKSTGKTLLAIEAIANFQRKYPDGIAVYNETEAAFDRDYAASLGIPVDGITMVSDCFTVEDLFNHINKMLSEPAGRPVIYVVDSLDALSDEGEMESDFSAASYGAKKAQRLSKFFRQINKHLSQRNFLLIFVSQIRDNIGVTFGRKYTRSGGHSLDFYCTHVVWLAHLKRIEKQSEGIKRVIGVRIKANIEKNKVAPPHRFVEMNILFGYGVDDVSASISWLEEVIGSGKDESLETIAPGATSVKLLKKSFESVDTDEKFHQFKSKLDDLVAHRWASVESKFIPSRRKYS